MIKAHHLKHLKGKHGKFPTVPVVAAAAGGLLLLMLSKSASAKTSPTPPTPPPPTPPLPPLPNVRPKRTPTPPPGTKYWATVAPVCGPSDKPSCKNGLLVHTETSTSEASRVGPEDVSPTSPHLLTGDEAAVIRDDIVDPTGNGRVWAEIVTPTNVHGFVSFHGPNDPAGSSNFTNVQPFQPVTTSGYAAYGYNQTHGRYYPAVGAAPPRTGWAPQRSWLRCVAPSGCSLGTPDGRSSGIVVENGGMVKFLGTSGDGSAMHVLYYDKVHGRAFSGWVDGRWLR